MAGKALTVREALTLAPFRGSRVLAGEAGLDRPVGAVNLTDLSDYADWLSPGDLLVTTCFSLRDDQAAQEAFVPTLAAHRLAGVCIKPRRFLDEIPGFMVQAAGEAGLPIIELPGQARFRDISWAVFEAVRSRTGAAPMDVDNPELLAFLRHLYLDAVTDETAEQARGEYLDCDLSRPFRVARFQLLPAAEGEAPSPTQAYFLYRSLLSLLRSAGLSCAAAVDGDQLLLVLSGLPEPKRLAELLRSNLEALASGYPELRFLLAYSQSGLGTGGMRRCCGEARSALRRGGRADGPAICLCFSELGLDRLLYADDPQAEACRLAGDMLGPLLAEPEKYGELLTTLSCYFRCMGNLKRVSEALHTHYNTVSYRLRQVQELTGRDLHDPDDRFLLELALRIS